MSNNLTSNVTRKVARVFLEKFEASRTLSKSVNTQLLSGKFNPSSGANVDFKRPHDYNTLETSGGDISSSTKSDIISGKATGTVQNYITVPVEFTGREEALELDQLDEIIAPAATRIITKLEQNLGEFMLKNSGLAYGSPGTAVDAWSDVAGAAAMMRALGVPEDGDWYYTMGPFTQMLLADKQSALSGPDGSISSAWERSMLTKDFAGFKVMTSNALKSRTSSDAADRAGSLSAAPTATYVAHKDTMQQVWAVTGFTANADLKAGDVLEVTGRYYRSMATRDTVIDHTGAQVKFRAIVTADVTLGASGEGNVTVSAPAIFEANGQYNTVSAALDSGDVITILGSASAIYQPNLFYHKQAFGLGTVKLPKLYSTDTVATTEDGMSIRVSKYSDGDANKQMIRFDLLPAFACFNPYFSGHGYGVA